MADAWIVPRLLTDNELIWPDTPTEYMVDVIAPSLSVSGACNPHAYVRFLNGECSLLHFWQDITMELWEYKSMEWQYVCDRFAYRRFMRRELTVHEVRNLAFVVRCPCCGKPVTRCECSGPVYKVPNSQ